LIKELNAESPQFRRLNDLKSRRQVGFQSLMNAARAGSWPTVAETCRRVAAAGRRKALNAARWHALTETPRCPVQSLALTHSLSSSRSRVRRGTAMAELAASASPCLWAPSCPSVCATGSAALLLASRAPPRPSFAAVARGHRCRGRCECLCARPGQPGPPPA